MFRHAGLATLLAILCFCVSPTSNVYGQAQEQSILLAPSIGFKDPEALGFGSSREHGLVDALDDTIDDPWFSPDKFLHASISFLLTLSAQYAYEAKFGMARMSALPLSMFSASMVGVGKEVYDWQLGPRRYFSVKDIAANSVGIVIAATFIVW